MENLGLRPMETGEIIERTLALYRRHLSLFCGIALLPSAVSGLAGAALRPYVYPPSGLQSDPQPRDLIVMIAAGLASFLLAALVAVVIVAASSTAVLESARDGVPTLRTAYRPVWPRLGSVVAIWLFFVTCLGAVFLLSAVASLPFALGFLVRPTMFLAGVPVFLLGLAAGLLYMVRYALAVPASVLEGIGWFSALGRSAALSRGGRLRLVLVVFLMTVIAGVVTVILTIPFQIGPILGSGDASPPAWLLALEFLCGLAADLVGLPLQAIAIALLYLDALAREGSSRPDWPILGPIGGGA